MIAKEKHAIAGRTLSQGLIHERDTVAGADGAIIARMPRAAGGFVHARATSPELSLRDGHPFPDVGRDPQSVEP